MRGGWRACADRCARRELARLHLQPTHSCPALDSSVHSAASSTASTTTVGDKVAATFLGGASFFTTTLCSSRGCAAATRWLRGGLEGGLELHDGDFGGFGSAATRQLSFGSLGGPRARLRRLCGALCRRPTAHALRRGSGKKVCACEWSFWAISACLSACRCASERPKLRATRRYARRVLGPRTQSTIIPPSGTAKARGFTHLRTLK